MAFSDQESPAVANFIPVIVGYGVSRVLGANLWFPLLLAYGCIFVISKIRPRMSLWPRYAVGLLLGHTLALTISVIFVPEMFGQVALDLVVGFGLTAWALIAGSRSALITIMIFEVLALALNGFTIMQIGQWGLPMAGVTVAVLMRLAVIVSGILALKDGQMTRQMSEKEESEVFS